MDLTLAAQSALGVLNVLVRALDQHHAQVIERLRAQMYVVTLKAAQKQSVIDSIQETSRAILAACDAAEAHQRELQQQLMTRLLDIDRHDRFLDYLTTESLLDDSRREADKIRSNRNELHKYTSDVLRGLTPSDE